MTSWFLKHLPGEAIFAASSPRVIPLSFSLLVLNLIFLGGGGAGGGREFSDFLRGSQPLSQRGPS